MGFEDTITLFDGSSVAVSKATGRPGPGEGENPSAMAGWGLKALANAVNTLATGLPGGTTAATAGTAVATDATAAARVDVTATASFTLSNPTGASNGQKLLWRIWNNSVGTITISLGANFNYGAGVPALPTLAAGKVLYVAAVYRTLGAVTKWDLVAVDTF